MYGEPEYLLRFGGGLGDILLKLQFRNIYNNLTDYLRDSGKHIIISMFGTNRYAYEIFESNPYRSQMIICRHNRPMNNLTMTDMENLFLKKNKLSCNIKRTFDPFKSPIGENKPMYKFFNDTDMFHINNLKNLNIPIIVLSAGASSPERHIPEHIILDMIDQEDYLFVRIGKDASNIKNNVVQQTEPIICHDKIINLVNYMSIYGNLGIMDLADGIITTDSSAICYGGPCYKNMALIVRDLNFSKYGILDKSTREGYYDCLDRDNVIITDFPRYNSQFKDEFYSILDKKRLHSSSNNIH